MYKRNDFIFFKKIFADSFFNRKFPYLCVALEKKALIS